MRKLGLVLSLALVAALATSAAAFARPSAGASVIGGTTAPAGSWPWAAFIADLQGDEGSACTGTVVAPRVVVTAAHCVTDANAGDYHVVTGSLDWTDQSKRQESGATQVVTFPNWQPTSRFGDAGLIILSTPTTAPAITLASLNDIALLRAGRSAAVAGWGQTSASSGLPSALQEGTVQLQGPSYCGDRAAELNNGYQPAGMLCTVDSRNFAIGPCHGDSGGPLVMTRADRTPVQVGITSAVASGCTLRFPGYYTRADVVANWVNAWVAAVASSSGSGPIAAPTLPPASNAAPPLGQLTAGEVPGEVRSAILAKMGSRFRGAKGYRSRCRRKSATAAQCAVSWAKQGTAYAGVVTISLRFDRVQRLVVVGSKAKFTQRRARG